MQQAQMQELQQQIAQITNLVQAGALLPEMAQTQIAQLQQQMQQSQMPPDQVEARVSQVESELLQEVMPLLTYKGEGGAEQDPLVTIRMQELAIKEMEASQKAQMEQAKLQLDQMKLEQQATTDSARLELQEQIADGSRS